MKSSNQIEQFKGRNTVLGIVIAVVVLVTFLVLIVPDHINVTVGDKSGQVRLIRDDFELSVFYDRGSWLPSGLTPYNDEMFQEYPQLGLGYITLPYLFSDTYNGYRSVLILFNALCLIGLIIVTAAILKYLDKSSKYLLLFLLPSVLYFSFSRFDVLVALLVQISLLLVLTRKYKTSFFVLALAVLTKWYAVLFVPIYWYYIRKKNQNQKNKNIVRHGLIIFFAIIFLVLIISYAVDGLSSLGPYLFHGSRPAGVGSLYYLIFDKLFTSFELTNINYLGMAVFFFVQLLVPILFIFFSQRFSRNLDSSRMFIMWLTVAILGFLIFSRFYSPQWIIWFLPLLMLVTKNVRTIMLIIIYDLLNFLAFPIIWQLWGPLSTVFVIISILIVSIGIIITIMLMRDLLNPNRNPVKLLTTQHPE